MATKTLWFGSVPGLTLDNCSLAVLGSTAFATGVAATELFAGVYSLQYATAQTGRIHIAKISGSDEIGWSVVTVESDTEETFLADELKAASDATLAKQEEILTDIAGIQSSISSIISVAGVDVGTVTGFPSRLGIGDSRSATLGNQIQLYLRDANDDPVSGYGTKAFDEATFRPEIRFAPKTNGRNRKTAEVVLSVDDGDLAWVTDVDPELEHLLVSIPKDKSVLASPGEHLWQLIIKWSDEANEEQTAVSRGSVEWFLKPAAS